LFEILGINQMQEPNIEQPQKSNEICSLTMVRRVAAMLDLDTQAFSNGDILPRSWHFFMLAGETRKSELRQDGFPGLGVSIPDLSLERLLLGGRTVSYNGDIVIGSEIERTSFVKDIKEKTTPSGRMSIVTIQHELRPVSDSKPAIIETQTYILKSIRNEELGFRNEKTIKNEELGIRNVELEKKNIISHQLLIPNSKFLIKIPDETLLFQYSALGFNSHKIHLDRDYARNIEGLPDLVVNGGLATILLTEFIRVDLGLKITEIKIKHIAPLYCNRPLTIIFEQGDLKIYDDNNEVAVICELKIRNFVKPNIPN
jgi:3-methylfumaryl-CoA hydratase